MKTDGESTVVLCPFVVFVVKIFQASNELFNYGLKSQKGRRY